MWKINREETAHASTIMYVTQLFRAISSDSIYFRAIFQEKIMIKAF